jgi:hypothetical protein
MRTKRVQKRAIAALQPVPLAVGGSHTSEKSSPKLNFSAAC